LPRRGGGARGRAARIEKPFAQITVVLRQVEEPA
jgi:ribosomal protein L22